MAPVRAMLCLVVGFLVGCATSKPVADASVYDYVGAVYVAGVKCGREGMVDANTAAAADRRVKDVLSRHEYVHTRYIQSIDKYWNLPAPTIQECNYLAIEMAKVQQQVASHMYRPSSNQQPVIAVPTQTYCNRTGTQTICSTY